MNSDRINTRTSCGSAAIMTQSGIHTYTQILMNNVKTLILPSCTKAKVTPIIFEAAAVLQPRNDCFSLHYLCTRLTGRWVERWRSESGRRGNHGTVCHSACARHYLSSQQMKRGKAGETWPGLI